MKKFFNTLFNIFWAILVGSWGSLLFFCAGIVYCLTLIGIPFGIRYFKFIKLFFAPAGKRVVTHYGKRPVLNTLWMLSGGFISWLCYALLAIVFYITIIGIPIGRQLGKMRNYCFAPFGAEILKYGEEGSEDD